MSSFSQPSPTGVRITGDHYQWLVAWQACLRALQDKAGRTANPVIAVGVEAADAGSLDDVVLYRAAPPHTHNQVKYAVDATSPVNEEYLFKLTTPKGTSIIRKIATTWSNLREQYGNVDLAIVTNRFPDPADPLVSQRDGRTQTLMPRAAEGGPRSAKGEARGRWAAAADVTEEELIELLGVLRFDVGRDLQRLREEVAKDMRLVGLDQSDRALAVALEWVAGNVREGTRRLDLDTIEAAVRQLDLQVGPGLAVVSVSTIVHDPEADSADLVIDWVDRFDGDIPERKRRPLAPFTWNDLSEELDDLPAHVPAGATEIGITGKMRLATAFKLGTVLRRVRDYELSARQNGIVWSSRLGCAASEQPAVTTVELGLGDDLAVLVSISADATPAVEDHLRSNELPVARLLSLNLQDGTDSRVKDAVHANALTLGIRDVVRKVTRGTGRVHLFLACPSALALLLGHQWNRIGTSAVYEEVLGDLRYEQAYLIET